MSLEHAPEELRNNRKFVMAAVSQNGMALQFASEDLREATKVCEAAVMQCPKALQFCSEENREDEELVKAAVEKDGSVLVYAGNLRGHRRVAPKAVKQSWEALPHEQVDGGVGHESLLISVTKDWQAIGEILKKETWPSEEELLAMAAANPEIVRTPELRGHYEVAKVALTHDGLMLHYLLPALRNDFDLVTVAVRQNGKAVWEAHPDLRGDKRLLDWAKNTENRKRREVWRAEKAAKEAALNARRKSVMDDDIAEMLEAEEEALQEESEPEELEEQLEVKEEDVEKAEGEEGTEAPEAEEVEEQLDEDDDDDDLSEP